MKKVGIANGVAWTPEKCRLLQACVKTKKGTGNILMTGDMGAALVKAIDELLTLFNKTYPLSKLNTTIALPGPLDGPSASVAVYVALYSAVTKTPISQDTAFIGAIDECGDLLEVDEIAEKIRACMLAGLRQIIMPIDNFADLRGIDYGDLVIGGARNIDDVLILAKG